MFCSPIICGILLLEWQLLHKPFVSSYAAKEYLFKKQNKQTEILFLGSSQLLDAVVNDSFENKIFNFSNVSQTLHYSIEITNKHLPQLPKIKTVVIGISYFSFFYQLQDIQENWRTHYYKLHQQLNPSDNEGLNPKDYFATALYTPRQFTNLLLHNFINEEAKNLTPYGSLFKHKHETINDSISKARVDFLNSINFTNRNVEIKAKLKQFISSLHQQKINIVFVTTPVHQSFYKFCDKKIVNDNEAFINMLCKDYNASYLNLFNSNYFNDNDFANCDHLHFNGANKFSGLLQQHFNKFKVPQLF